MLAKVETKVLKRAEILQSLFRIELEWVLVSFEIEFLLLYT